MSRIAIVGMSCLFPGALSIDSFWKVLKNGSDCRDDANAEDFGMAVEGVYHPDPGVSNIYNLKGGFIRGFEFDDDGFRLDQKKLRGLDNVFKWSLHVTREALRDAGLWRQDAKLNNAGLILGNYAFPTKTSNKLALPIWQNELKKHVLNYLASDLGNPDLKIAEQLNSINENSISSELNRFASGMPASVVADACGLSGPHYTIDAACSSALYSIKMASLFLASGKVDFMLAGGICAPDPWLIHTSFSDLQAYPVNGVSQPFSEESTGIQTGQGAGVVVLKRLEDAVRDGDNIYCTIEGLGLSNDGAGKHLLAPNPDGQIKSYQRAYAESHVTEQQIEYVECHATGTSLGDQTELESLERHFGSNIENVKIGSVKGQTGHLLTVAGLTSLIKLILCLKHEELAPTPGVPVGKFRESKAGLITEKNLLSRKEIWKKSTTPRYAAVSAFGFGGTNAHLILSDDSSIRDPKSNTIPNTCLSDSVPSKAHAKKITDAGLKKESEISVVGMGAHYGKAESLIEFERMLFRGSNSLHKDNSKERFGLLDSTDRDLGFVKAVEIDPFAYKIPPVELTHFNKQQLLMLKVANDALLDAGLKRDTKQERNIAVILVLDLDLTSHLRRAKGELPIFLKKILDSVGVSPDEIDMNGLIESCGEALHKDIEPNEVLSYIGNIMASRISSLWNFSGPAFTLSGNGNGVIDALDTAALLLESGESDRVLLGAVDLACVAEEIAYQELNSEQSNDNPINPSGEGAGAVVLMRNEDAQHDSIRRYSTIKMAHSTELNKADQTENLDVGLVGICGVPCSDKPVELVEKLPSNDKLIALFNLSERVGYSRHSAPIGGLIAGCLSLYHKYYPASGNSDDIHCERLDAFDSSGCFFQPSVSYPWFKSSAGIRAAVITARAFSGRDQSVLLKEADWPGQNEIISRDINLFPITANDFGEFHSKLEALQTDLTKLGFQAVRTMAWRQYSERNPDVSIAVLSADSLSALMEEIVRFRNYLDSPNCGVTDWKTPKGSYFSCARVSGDISFVYPGGFNSHPYLANGLFRLFPTIMKYYEDSVDDVSNAMASHWIYPVSSNKITSKQLMEMEQSMLQDIPAMLTNGTSMAILYTKIMRDIFNIKPSVAFGYSLGESSMLFANRVWPAKGRDYEQLRRSELFKDVLTGKRTLIRKEWALDNYTDEIWDCYVLMADRLAVEKALSDYDRVYITHINTQDETLVAGCPKQLTSLIKNLGCNSVKTPTAHVLHAEVMSEAKQALAELNSYPATKPESSISMISAYDYEPIKCFEQSRIAEHNSESLCKEVDFPRLMDKAYELGARVFVEVGPGGTCSRWVDKHFSSDNSVASVSVSQRGKPDVASFTQLIARMVSIGVPINAGLFDESDVQLRPTRPIDIKFTANTKSPDFSHLRPATWVVDRKSLSSAHKPVLIDSQVSATAGTQMAAACCTNTHALSEHTNSITDTVTATSDLGSVVRLNQEFTSEAGDLLYWSLFSEDSHSIHTPELEQEIPSLAEQLPDQIVDQEDVMGETGVFRSISHTLVEGNEVDELYIATSNLKKMVVAQSFDSIPNLKAVNTESNPLLLISSSSTLEKKTDARIDCVGSADQGIPESVTLLKNSPIKEINMNTTVIAAVESDQDVPSYLDLLGIDSDSNQASSDSKSEVDPNNAIKDSTLAELPTAKIQNSNSEATVILNEKELLAFAEGRISDAFGSEYAEIDNYPVRVRLPAPPYFFVSRVTRLEATRGKYEKCMLTTEYDVPEDAWYLVDGVMPPGIAVEAGQSDLLLISYLGIDLENKGERFYRLLDGKLAFLGDLPRAGETLKFDIHINSYVSHGDVFLFFFSYEGYVNDRLALKLERGCAGFFTKNQLEQGNGLVKKPALVSPTLAKPLIKPVRTELLENDIVSLCHGELNQVFGQGSEPVVSAGVRLPPEMLMMVDRVSILGEKLDSGYIRMEGFKKLDPNGWYFNSHFVDDPVLPGSLVAEGATQLLKIHLMSVGMHQSFTNAEFQPVPELMMDIKVRGQITPDVSELRYEVDIFESGLLPRPYVRANVVVYDKTRPLVAIENLGLCLKEKPGCTVYPRYGEADYISGRELSDGSPVVINEFHLAHAAKGDLKTAMGKEFGIYGPDHRAPHIPNGDFQFVDRALALTGDRGKFQNGSVMVTEYDVPEDAWYFKDNAYADLPNCVYLESALQASILLGYFLGVTLEFPEKELSIRNLNGYATYHKNLDLRGKTIRHKETLLSTNTLNGSILQNFKFELTVDGELIYDGESLFGYFPAEALENQLGLDRGRSQQFWLDIDPKTSEGAIVEYGLESEVGNKLFAESVASPYYHLASNRLNLLHDARVINDGGKFSQGYVFGHREIRENDWYYKCHFHRDPVMPGHNGIGKSEFESPRFGIATDVKTEWKYRGHLLMTDSEMNIEVHIKSIQTEADRILIIADCDLFKEKLRIYEVLNMAIAVTEGD